MFSSAGSEQKRQRFPRISRNPWIISLLLFHTVFRPDVFVQTTKPISLLSCRVSH